MNKRFLITALTLVAILGGAAVAVFFAKGYTFSSKNEQVVGTGIISVTSVPEGAAVYVDGHLTTATNGTVPSLPPKKYHIKIAKDGFIPWENDLEVRQGIVTDIKATLFPSIPTVYPLTYNGVASTLISPDGQKLAFTVPYVGDSSLKEKGGVWVWTMSSQPISFSRSAEPHQILASTGTLDFSKASIKWSPDSKQLLVTFSDQSNKTVSERNYLLSVDQTNSVDNIRDITATLAATLKSWQADQKTKDDTLLAEITDLNLKQVATDSAYLKWSPDETAFMVAGQKKKPEQEQLSSASSSAQVKDLGQFSIYVLADKLVRGSTYHQYNLPYADFYSWLPDSKHIVLISDNKIIVCDLDGTNQAVIYAGSFNPLSVYAWPDSSRIVLVSSFPIPTASKPNLFGINLK